MCVGCKRVLTRDGYMVHEGYPFCQGCYWESNRLFKPPVEGETYLLHNYFFHTHKSRCMYVLYIVCEHKYACMYVTIFKCMDDVYVQNN